jgi:hypothetical protein
MACGIFAGWHSVPDIHGEYFRLEHGDPINPWRRSGHLPFTSRSRDGRDAVNADS